MTNPFALAQTLPGLGAHAASYLDLQRPDGSLARADWELDDPGGTCGLAALCLYAAAMRRRFPAVAIPGPDDATLFAAAARALDYLEAYQRPSGLTDLRDCNFDSSPDAGFILQAICPAIEAARGLSPEAERLEAFARRMTVGAMQGGFHTPNHRWVIAAALAQAGRLFPEIDVRPVLDAYLAEGFDLDADGAFLERSAGVYDAICDRSLLLLFDDYGYAPALDAALRNLDLDRFLFHADGTIETGLSRRQDYGTRAVPSTMIAPYLWAGLRAGRPDLIALARWLQEKAPADAYSLTQVLQRCGEPDETAPAAPEAYARHFPALGVHRIRRGPLSATLFTGTTRLLHLVCGRAELASVKISQSYFGVGRFVGDSLAVDGAVATLRSEGKSSPYRPGYEQPLGRPVPPDRYAAMRAEREIRRLPPCTSELTVREIPDGLALRYRTLDGYDRVPAQIALDFAPGGIFESEGVRFEPRAGQVLFLDAGFGSMRYGQDVLTVGPGAHAHRMAAMRDAETAPEHVRILLTFLAPADHEFTLGFSRRKP